VIACRSGCIAGVLEAAKKGTLKVDLQALTVGAALLTMHRCFVQLCTAAGWGHFLHLAHCSEGASTSSTSRGSAHTTLCTPRSNVEISSAAHVVVRADG